MTVIKKLACLDGSQFFLLSRTGHEFFKNFVDYFSDPVHSINNDWSLIITLGFFLGGGGGWGGLIQGWCLFLVRHLFE